MADCYSSPHRHHHHYHLKPLAPLPKPEFLLPFRFCWVLLAVVICSSVVLSPTDAAPKRSNFWTGGSEQGQHESSSPTVPAHQEEMKVGGGFRLELSHPDAFDGRSLADPVYRLVRAVERSKVRASRLRTKALRGTQPTSLLVPREEDFRVPLSSDEGAYITTISLGTPEQKFTGIVDTGSDLVWRQCEPCVLCYQQNGSLFDPSLSSTYEPISCGDKYCSALPMPLCPQGSSSVCSYYYSYGDGSTTVGNLAYDTLTAGGQSAAQFAFGCGTFNFGNIGQLGTGGLIGMGQGTLSLPSQLSQLIDNKFSYCLVTWTDAPSKTSPLLFGADAHLRGSGVKSTPLVASQAQPTFYYLSLEDISVARKPLHIPPGTFSIQSDGTGGVVIDSGTTITFLEEAGYTPLLDAVKAAISLPQANSTSVGLDLCYNVPAGTKLAVPPVTFHFTNADIELPPENVFMEVPGLSCLAFATMQGISIFGNIQQQNIQFLYDRGNQQLSFKPATCDAL